MRCLRFVPFVLLLACGQEQAPASKADAAASGVATPVPVTPPPTAAATAEATAVTTPEYRRPDDQAPLPEGFGGPGGTEGGRAGAGSGKASKLAAIAELSEGTLDRSEVQSAIDASVGRFTPCLQVESRVRVRATISKTGEVADAAVVAADPDEPKLRDCVAAVFRKVVFPKPKGADATTFTVDLVLRPELKL
jgi:hypothetical protein